jgi:isopentenyl-diphosphate Delta-isomerase
VIATGGIARGLDVAHAIALGASAAGIARPVLKALHEGGRAGAVRFLEGVEAELRTAMLLVGARDVDALKQAPRVIGGELAVWLRQSLAGASTTAL